jgi:DNA-binding MarR family transcriptional regulator
MTVADERASDADAGEAPFSPTIALVTVSRVVEVQLASLLEPHGLTVRKYAILGHIAATPGLSLSDLGRRSRITVQSVHAVIKTLTDAGLVRSTTETNGLAAQVTVTTSGIALLDRLRREVAALDAEAFASPAWRDLSASLSGIVAERAAQARPTTDGNRDL